MIITLSAAICLGVGLAYFDLGLGACGLVNITAP